MRESDPPDDKTSEEIGRVLGSLAERVAAMREQAGEPPPPLDVRGEVAVRLLIVARKARAYLLARYPTTLRWVELRAAVEDLIAAERASGVDVTSPREEDLAPSRSHRKGRR